MNIFVYSDESGVFDKVHNDYFVFGGLILLGKKSKDEWSRRYIAAEKTIRKIENHSSSYELKATNISNKSKGKLFRSLNNCYKFSAIINQNLLNDKIFETKKHKQRYLDYAFKISLKRAFQSLIQKQIVIPAKVDRIYCRVDEHTTATNGRYELREALEQEFKSGTINYKHNCFFPPIFPSLKEVQLEYCNSESNTLIRAADIIANRVYSCTVSNNDVSLSCRSKLNLCYLPIEKQLVRR